MLRKQAEQKDCKLPLQDRFSVLSSKEDVTRSQNSGLEALIMYQKAVDLLRIAVVLKHVSTT